MSNKEFELEDINLDVSNEEVDEAKTQRGEYGVASIDAWNVDLSFLVWARNIMSLYLNETITVVSEEKREAIELLIKDIDSYKKRMFSDNDDNEFESLGNRFIRIAPELWW